MARRLAGPLAGMAAATYVLTWKSVAIAAMVAVATATGVVAAVRVAPPKPAPAVVEPAEARPVPPLHGAMPPLPPSLQNEPGALETRPSRRPARSRRARHQRPASASSTRCPRCARRRRRGAGSIRGIDPTRAHALRSARGVDTLAAELALLEQARASYDSDPAQTLAVLNEHARRFPAGKLSLERELLALDALKRLGMVSSERARAESLLPQVRGTIYEQRVRSHLEQPAAP